MDKHVTQARIAAAIEALRLNDAHLLEIRCGERSIVGRLQIYLAGVFPSHDVDIEYNRHGIDAKRVPLRDECRKHATRNPLVIPDIVIHRRGTNDSNIVVIEVKPDDRGEDDIQCDRSKLAAIRTEFSYLHSVLLIVPVGNRASDRPVLLEWDGDGIRAEVA